MDVRTGGYIMFLNDLLNAGIAVDRTFFHKTVELRLLSAVAALAWLAAGAWMIVKGRAPRVWIDDRAKARWGWRGSWFVTAVFGAVVVASTWWLSRLG
jgi:hypothetical protein